MSYHAKPQPGQFVVLVRDDTKPDGTKGNYACSHCFDSYAQAKAYLEGCSPSREPVVVCVIP